jgi:hypothetical protein
MVDVTGGKPFEQRAFDMQRPQVRGRGREAVGELQPAIGKSLRHDGLLAAPRHAHGTSGREIDRNQRVGAGGQTYPRSRAGELDDERPAFDGRDTPDAELGIETVCEIVAGVPGRS